MTLWKNYSLPRSVPEALQILSNANGPARLIAGGTDFLLDLQQGRHPPVDTLVDVTEIVEMRALEIRQERLFIGAAVPLNKVVASPLVRAHAEALKEAAALIGGPQVRNTATLGGNVAHALPAGDGTIALLALGAQAEIASSGGRRLAEMQDLFLGPGRTALDTSHELLVGFYLPVKGAGQGSAFRRVMRPQGVAIAIMNLAIWIRRQEGVVQDVRIAVGPAGPVPFRSRSAENVLRGQLLDNELIEAALHALRAEAHFRTSPHRATSEYRREMAGVLFREVLGEAWKRCD